jgi:hypothetical protein
LFRNLSLLANGHLTSGLDTFFRPAGQPGTRLAIVSADDIEFALEVNGKRTQRGRLVNTTLDYPALI